MSDYVNASTASILEPKLVFLPIDVVNTFKLTDTPIKDVCDLETMLATFGAFGVAYFVYVDYIYKTASSNFLKHELMPDFTSFDLMDAYRDQLDSKPGLVENYANIVKRLDVLKLEGKPLIEKYVKPQPDSAVDTNVVYYVPMLTYLGNSVYGVRLVAVTGATEKVNKKDICNAIVANIGVLSKSYETNQLVKLPYFEQYVELC